MPRLGELYARYPGLQLRVLTGNAQTDLSRGEAELAVRTPRPQQRELSAVKLGVSDFALFASPGVAARLGPRALEGAQPQLKDVPLLTYTAELKFLQSAPWFSALVAQSRHVLLTDSTLALLAAARAGVGVCVLPEFAVLREPELVRVARREVSRHEAWLVPHPDFRRDARVRAVATFLKDISPDLSRR